MPAYFFRKICRNTSYKTRGSLKKNEGAKSLPLMNSRVLTLHISWLEWVYKQKWLISFNDLLLLLRIFSLVSAIERSRSVDGLWLVKRSLLKRVASSFSIKGALTTECNEISVGYFASHWKKKCHSLYHSLNKESLDGRIIVSVGSVSGGLVTFVTIICHLKLVSCLSLANRKKGRKEFQWKAWNLFQMTADGDTHFSVTKP